MKVYRNIEEFVPVNNAVVTIGTFDGVHTGHQVIISRVKELADQIGGESVIITFYPHPQLVLHPEEKGIFVLNSLDEKIEQLRRQGINNLIIVPFTKEFAAISYTDFIKHILIDKLHVRKLVIGYDHQFGKDREGSYQHLEEYGKQFQFEVEEVTAQKVAGTTISSTKIRKALLAGDMLTANTYLGYKYAFSGTVVEGNRIGNTLGFPTANIDVAEPFKLIPANGVYAVEVEYKNTRYEGMLNIGFRPTINGTTRVIEVNLFNFNQHIYSESLTVHVVGRLRDELKFSDLEELKKQLEKDRKNATTLLKSKI